ncbi:hypothetical protein [Streptomyces sp. NRRL B-24484]|nr:hypothetical protein [Streptomyces sp. NRRL B-24484]
MRALAYFTALALAVLAVSTAALALILAAATVGTRSDGDQQP